MKSKGQVEYLALVGIALLILGLVAYYTFFRQLTPEERGQGVQVLRGVAPTHKDQDMR